MEMKQTERWRGYDGHELRIKRAVNAVRLEIAKEALFQKLEGASESPTAKVGSFLFNNPALLLRTVTIGSTVFSIMRTLFGKRRR